MGVFKKSEEPRAPTVNKLRQRGQIALLYALLIPTLFFFVGLVFDLSWYYINVSRLQNAADAAVIAGASKLIEREESLSEYNYTTFVNGFNENDTYESTRDTFHGDKIAKSYVEKNLAKGGADWEDNSIMDLWTRKNVSFTSSLMGDDSSNFGILYYHVMLEEEVPHMFLGGHFPGMDIKVSSVAKITQFIKGYDFFRQIKQLLQKQTYESFKALKDKKGEVDANNNSILPSKIYFDKDNNRYIETMNFPNDTAYPFDNLFVGVDPIHPPVVTDEGGRINPFYQMYRIIDINTVYPVRDYNFYINNYQLLRNFQDKNSDYSELMTDELARIIAKEPPDPLYIRIESEPQGDSVRQVIINVNVSNMDEKKRPIILFYDGPEYDESLPVILRLNNDFRGVLYAPNSPVVIIGNNNAFHGFVVAESFIQPVIKEVKDEYDNVISKDLVIDEFGEVQYQKNLDGTYRTVDNFALSTFDLIESEFDSFNLVNFEEYTVANTYGMANNLFMTEKAKEIK